MLTRRQLLSNASLAAAAGLALGDADAAPKTQAVLPAPLERLQSRSADATPIGADEHRARLEQARTLLVATGLDALVLAEGTSLTYFTGARWWGSERLFAAVVPARGAPFYVCPAFEEGRAREQLIDGEHADVRIWQEDENPYARLAEGLRDRGIAAGKIGLEENVRFVFADGIANAAPQVRLASGTSVTAGCRMIKSAHEISLMRLAAQLTLAAYEATYHSIRVGMTQHEVSELSRQAHERLGFSGAADLVLIGESSAFPHGSVKPQRITEGSIVLFDGGCDVHGYKSDITRTFVIGGKPTARMKSVFEVVQSAQLAALRAARPGVECGAIDAAARSVITAAGFGPDYRTFTHRLGHGMGMDGHEWPYLVRGNSTRLAPGMTTSNEPGIYLRGEFGIRLEDDMHILDAGAELFTARSRSLEEPFAAA